MIQEQELVYLADADTYIGRLVWDDTISERRPGVLIAPAFGGLGPFEVARAHEIAELGYVALAVDYYGNGTRAQDEAEAFRLMQTVNTDRASLARRMTAALTTLKGQDQVAESRIAAMGYCLGGKAVLDLARTGASFQACIPIHGVYDPPPLANAQIQPSVLVLHGWDDPLATPESLASLATELSEKGADWQVLGFGHTGHAFTNPNAQSQADGIAYNAKASDRAWSALTRFLEETIWS